MAIDDVSFYSLTGEEINRSYLVNQMMGFYGLLLEAGQSKVTDFNEGSVIRNMLEGFSVLGYILLENQNELLSTAFVESAEGEFLDKHGANPFIKLERDEGNEATGYVTFTVPSALTSEAVIPEGTIVVNSSTGLEYSTLNDVVFDTENTSVTVAVECLTVGEDGNCGIGDIDTIDEIIAEIPELSVTNENKITDGSDYEEDEEYRQRLLDYIRQDDFGSYPHYLRIGESVTGVHDIALINDVDEEYTKIILVNGYSKPTPLTVLAEVLEVYTDVNNKIIDHNFTVDKPEYITVDVDVDLSVSVEVDENLVETLISDFFNGTSNMPVAGFEYSGLYMGEDLTNNMLESNIELLDGVLGVSVTLTVDNTDYSTVTVAENEVCKLGTVTVTQTTQE